MIQVCSRCGTRWNVRDQQRGWCPRCNGALLAPTTAPVGPPAPGPGPNGPNSSGPAGRPPVGRPGQKRAAGFRWIAVRPGPPPAPRRRRRPLGPTPRYQTIPRWGLVDRIGTVAPAGSDSPAGRSASPTAVRVTMLVAAAVLAVAALAHVLRYVLLLINRTTLLSPLVANGSLLMGVLVSLAAIVAVIAAGVAATAWLITRRAEVFRRHGQPDPRPEWALWAGCLVPVVNLVWAPVFVLELTHAEHSYPRLRGPVVTWWIAWIVATLISGWAIWTSGATEAQAVADNTVTVVIAYLAGLAVMLLLLRVFDGFVRRPMAQRELHRWVIVSEDAVAIATDGDGTEPARADSAAADSDAAEAGFQAGVESRDREPAA